MMEIGEMAETEIHNADPMGKDYREIISPMLLSGNPNMS